MLDQFGILINNFVIDDISDNTLKDIFAYWLAMKDALIMPSRRDLNPADIVALLPHISLIDVGSPSGRYRIRLLGTKVVEALGKDITGKYIDECPDIETCLKPRYDWIVENKRPYLIFDKLKWSHKSFLEFCSVGMPMSSDGRQVDIIMYGSCFYFPQNN